VENGETTSSDGSGTPCPPDDSDDPNDPNDPTNDDNDSGAGNGGCTVNCGGDGHDDNTNEPGGGDGGGNGSEICSVEIRYDACCNGNVEPHGEEECGCGPGNLDTMTITISCQGGSRTADLEPFECDNTIGVLLKDDDCDTSKEDLKKIFPSASDSDMELLASVINDKGKDFGIDNAIKLQHFLAQAGHETGGFTTLNVTESTYWTTASKLAKTYSKFTMDSAQASTNANLYYAPSYLQNSSGVANIAMCCQYGNGNVESGDGYKYRGRGIFQLTWKDNYSAFKTWYNNKYDPDKDFVTNPGLVSSNDTIAILSGLWYYKTRVLDKITIDSTTTVSKVTIPINSAEKGIKDRKAKFKKAKDSIKCL
jgi:putative chitinase